MLGDRVRKGWNMRGGMFRRLFHFLVWNVALPKNLDAYHVLPGLLVLTTVGGFFRLHHEFGGIQGMFSLEPMHTIPASIHGQHSQVATLHYIGIDVD